MNKIFTNECHDRAFLSAYSNTRKRGRDAPLLILTLSARESALVVIRSEPGRSGGGGGGGANDEAGEASFH